jgi:hypothetical protein
MRAMWTSLIVAIAVLGLASAADAGKYKPLSRFNNNPTSKSGLFKQRRRAPRRVKPKINSQLLRAIPILGGSIKGRPLQKDVAFKTSKKKGMVRQTRSIRVILPGWGNNQHGVRQAVEVYTDKETGHPVIRTIQKIKTHQRDTIRYYNPKTKRTEYVASKQALPKGATKVKSLDAEWLNQVEVLEVRTLVTSARGKKIAAQIKAELAKGNPAPAAARGYSAEPTLYEVGQKKVDWALNSPAPARSRSSFGVGFDVGRGQVTVGNQSPGGVVVNMSGQVGVSVGAGLVMGTDGRFGF